MDTILRPPGGQRVMFVLAHPDDAEFLCGGTVARLIEEGKDLHYFLVTRGDKGSDDPDMTLEQVAKVREQEQRDAAGAQGVQAITFLEGYYDGEVEPSIQLRKEISLVIRQWKPDIIFTFDPWRKNEIHPDHRAVSMCTLDAIACARSPRFYTEQLKNGVKQHGVRDVYFFNTDRANHWVDVSGVIPKKVAALKCHKSQMEDRFSDLEGWFRRRGAIEGAEHKLECAEALHHYKI